jgi:hypothetical protein
MLLLKELLKSSLCCALIDGTPSVGLVCLQAKRT